MDSVLPHLPCPVSSENVMDMDSVVPSSQLINMCTGLGWDIV